MRFHSFLLLVALSAGVPASMGCDRGPELVPVRGKVLYNGEPLATGTVMFQPTGGQPAQGEIQPDGTFELSTFGEGAGATVGRNQVAITAFAPGEPGQMAEGEPVLGPSLIPERYSQFTTSGLEVEVKPGENEPFVFELTD